MRILVLTDEARYVDDLVAAADSFGLTVATSSIDCDVETAARQAGANVVVFDAEDAFSPAAQAASAFAAAHPGTVVALAATGVDDGQVGNFVVTHRWHCAERLLGEIRQAYLSLRSPSEPRSSLAH